MPSERVCDNLYWRCRVGDSEALRTFLYQISDELYTVALHAGGSEQRAANSMRQTWRRLLQTLTGWRFGGYLHARTFRILRQILTREVGAEATRKAVDLVASPSADGSQVVIAAPADLVQELVAETRRWAPRLAKAAGLRQRRLRLLLAAVGLVVAVAIGIGSGLYGRMVIANSPQVQFRCLQQRIIEADLSAALRDAYGQLADPDGADLLRAQAYHRIGLILEEIANAPNLADVQDLRYIKQRIQSEKLAGLARAAAWDSSGYERRGLMHIVLVLEEVQSL